MQISPGHTTKDTLEAFENDPGFETHLEQLVDLLSNAIAQPGLKGSQLIKEQAQCFVSLSRYLTTVRYLKSDAQLENSKLQMFADLFLHLSGARHFPHEAFLQTTLSLFQQQRGKLTWSSHFYSFVRFAADEEISEEICKECFQTLRVLASEVDWSEALWVDFFQASRHLLEFGLAPDLAKDRNRVVRNYSGEMSFDFWSYGQFESKKILLEELQRVIPDLQDRLMVLLGGGYGLFAQLVFKGHDEAKGRVLSVDIDARANQIAEKLNNHLVVDGWKFKTITSDVLSIQYEESIFYLKRANGEVVEIEQRPDVYINTSCEHIEKFSEWRDLIPYDTLLALQSNNAFDYEGHVNCVETMEEFKKQARLSVILVEKVIQFEGYERFLLIGKA